MRKIDKMMHDALTIKDSLRATIFLVMSDIMEYKTEIHLKTMYGVEVITEVHESEIEAKRYIERMMEKYRKAPELAVIIDDF